MKLLETNVDFVSVRQWLYFSWSGDENIAGVFVWSWFG